MFPLLCKFILGLLSIFYCVLLFTENDVMSCIPCSFSTEIPSLDLSFSPIPLLLFALKVKKQGVTHVGNLNFFLAELQGAVRLSNEPKLASSSR